jgi:hypothetical protein
MERSWKHEGTFCLIKFILTILKISNLASRSKAKSHQNNNNDNDNDNLNLAVVPRDFDTALKSEPASSSRSCNNAKTKSSSNLKRRVPGPSASLRRFSRQKTKSSSKLKRSPRTIGIASPMQSSSSTEEPCHHLQEPRKIAPSKQSFSGSQDHRNSANSSTQLNFFSPSFFHLFLSSLPHRLIENPDIFELMYSNSSSVPVQVEEDCS